MILNSPLNWKGSLLPPFRNYNLQETDKGYRRIQQPIDEEAKFNYVVPLPELPYLFPLYHFPFYLVNPRNKGKEKKRKALL